jgi:hypothetical protein
MLEEHFKFGGDRCLSVWIIHGGVLLMILIIAPGILVQEGLPDFEGLIFGLGFLFFIFVPHTFLFLNHLKYEKETVVILEDDQISISKHTIKEL